MQFRSLPKKKKRKIYFKDKNTGVGHKFLSLFCKTSTIDVGEKYSLSLYLQECRMQPQQSRQEPTGWSLAPWDIPFYSVLLSAFLQFRNILDKDQFDKDNSEENVPNTVPRLENHMPVTTPRLAARDCMIRAAQEATNIIQSSCQKRKEASH